MSSGSNIVRYEIVKDSKVIQTLYFVKNGITLDNISEDMTL